ncbi:MAG TPA: hypothetical protein VF009_06590 [Solirubrobacterales bacterium]
MEIALQAIEELLRNARVQRESAEELEASRPAFRQRLKATLDNLPQGEVIEVPGAGSVTAAKAAR